jgi:glucose/arabinose dehydrogenase
MRRCVVTSLALVAGLAACGAGGSSDSATGSGSPPPLATATSRSSPARASALLRLVEIGRFDQPLYVTAPRGDRRRLFVVEQTGRIRVVRDGQKLAVPFLDLSARVSCCGERGLLSMAFAPDYARTGRFYVNYTDRNGDTRVEEYRRATLDTARASSRRLVLFQHQPEANHNGGQLQFGPDGLMYIGLGDGGGADDRHGRRGNAQSLGTLLGKILRIDPRRAGRRPYRVPRSNPFVGRRGARGEIYAYGLRNPWRFSFDRLTGDLAIGDVGQNAVEEIDFARRGGARGRNYGWRVWEGWRRNYPGERAAGAVRPVFQYLHSSGGCSITGGYVVRDRALAGYVGSYLYGDFCDGRLRAVRLAAGSARNDRRAARSVAGLSSFGEDAAGRIYVTSLNGPVYRLAP